jgi:hypothetical protein
MSIRPDNRLVDAPMVPVDCGHCGAQVLARKSTWDQTSVQWNSQASAACLERAEADKLTGHGRGLFLACSALRESIADAVRVGDLAIVDDVGDEVSVAQ